MKRVILFRFHMNPYVCRNRLELLNKFNPGVPIFGIFGGSIPSYKTKFKNLNPYLEDVFLVKEKHYYWKWLNGDLVLRKWYKKVGKKIDFDMLNIVEWDLLLFDSLNNIYKKIPKDGVGATGLVPLKNVEKKWIWTSRERYRRKWDKLLDFVKKEYNYNKEPYASLGPGTCLPREFLEKYSSAEVPELCHDEIRVPLFAQILGFSLYDTGFYKKWCDDNEKKFFNCYGKEINITIIKKELAKKSGRRVFHPYYKVIKNL